MAVCRGSGTRRRLSVQSDSDGLTKEFVVIQGPPRTGKTYIGLKVVEA